MRDALLAIVLVVIGSLDFPPEFQRCPEDRDGICYAPDDVCIIDMDGDVIDGPGECYVLPECIENPDGTCEEN